MNSTCKKILDYVIYIVLAVIIAYFINSFIILNAVIPSESMETTIMTGDRIIANRLAFLFSDVERGDIVIFPSPDDENKLLIKRVVGLPNEKINIINGDVYINDVFLEENYIVYKDNYNGDFQVPEDSYFLMGDNRPDSIDARYWHRNYIHNDEIIGKALFRYFPWPKLVK
ncbi:MAG: signal peptidase I [Lachnospirales bacterium]